MGLSILVQALYSIGSIREGGSVNMVYFVHYQNMNLIHCGYNEAITAYYSRGWLEVSVHRLFTILVDLSILCSEGFTLQTGETGSLTAGSPSPLCMSASIKVYSVYLKRYC